jgi:hypothetical protein
MSLLSIIEESNKDVALLLNKNLNDEERIIYNKCFESYIQYDDSDKFTMNLDDLWLCFGFLNRDKARTHLLKDFKPDLDYTIDFGEKEIIMMTVQTAKKLYMKADTEKSHKFCDYYIKLETIIHEIFSTKNKI